MPWIAVLVPPYLLFASFSGYGVVSISITTSVLVVSTIAFTLSKQKHKILKESVQEEGTTLNSQVEVIVSHQQPQNDNFGQVEEVKNPRIENGVENFGQVKEVLSFQNPRIGNGVSQIHDLYSESESLGGPSSSSSEDSDIDWPFTGELEQSPLCSDGSISDEESLIEIALPSGQFVKDRSFHQQNQKDLVFADLVPESIFQQHYLMDFLTDISDVYEEDNLIEIDISMGSIKCSGFEIPA